MREPSDIFVDAFCRAGTICARCDGCGRTYFNYDDGPNFDEGELEKLKQLEEKSCDVYIGVDHSIGLIHLFGSVFVVGCKCYALRKMEDSLLMMRQSLARYFKEMARRFDEEMSDCEAVVSAICDE